jgi:hypothetical protein
LYQQGDEFIGVGTDRGLLKLVWGWNGPTENKILIPSGSVADGEWHSLALSFSTTNISLWMDNTLVHATSAPDNTVSKPLTTDGIFYLGKYHNAVRFEVFTAVLMEIHVSWYVTLC